MKTPKSKKYVEERDLVQNKIISILNLNEGFYLYEIDNNDEVKKKIMDLVPDISKYFCHVNMTGLLYPKKCKRPWLSMVRGVLKDKYALKYKVCRYKLKNKSTYESIFTMKYYLVPIQNTNNLKKSLTLYKSCKYDKNKIIKNSNFVKIKINN